MNSVPSPTPAASPPAPRNPGPSWGFRFINGCDRVLPEFLFLPLRMVGTLVGLVRMKEQRRHSRAYLRVVLGREPSRRELFRHFFAFEETLLLKLRCARGRPHRAQLAPGNPAFRAWLDGNQRVILGTFHVGHSDLLGFLLGGKHRRPVHLVRLRVGNSHDTEALASRIGSWVRFVWVNQPEELLFSLKDAAAAEGAIALQCDRVDFSSRTEVFEFLGARRVFPFTLYHLALIFERPVLLCYGVPDGPDGSLLHSSPWFEIRAGEPRPDALARAREHFQAFLRQLEAHLRADPYLWHNFTALNPVAPTTPAPATTAARALRPAPGGLTRPRA